MSIDKKPRKDLTGQTFDRLTVMKFFGWKVSSNQRHRYSCWICRCKCGTQKVIRGDSLVNGGIRSCGCLLDEYRKNILPGLAILRNQLPKGEAGFRLLLCNYKTRAKKKNLEFSITSKDFRKLVLKPCYYCNREPYHIMSCKNRKKTLNGNFTYNGLDRIDNSLGYTLNNIVTCCGICNKARRDLSQKDFISWIKDITNHASKTDLYKYSLSS